MKLSVVALSLLIATMAVTVTGCQLPTEPTSPIPAIESVTIPFTTVAQGSNSSISVPNKLVITTSGQWQQLWQDMHSSRAPIPALPTIDFDTTMVIAVFAGEHPTAGYSITITQITDEGDHIQVNVKTTQPAAGGMTLQVLTQPYHLVQLAKSTKPIQFSY
jgi:hypothetical protein